MNVYIFGRLDTNIYARTTSYELAKLSKFTFAHQRKDFPKHGDVLIRYGVYSYPELDMDFKTVINTSEAIKLACDKLRASLRLRQHNIPVPQIFRELPLIDDLPVIKRDRYHSRGTDIVLIRRPIEIVDGAYYSKYIKSDTEYRVHIFDNMVIRLQKKVSSWKRRSWIHNVDHGYMLADDFTHHLALEKKIMEISLRAVQILGLDFGAVDVLIENKTYKPYVLEVNTGPRLNLYGRELYALYLHQKLGIPYHLQFFPRIRMNQGKGANGLPITFRDLKKKQKE